MAVELSEMPEAGCVYAHSGSDAIIRYTRKHRPLHSDGSESAALPFGNPLDEVKTLFTFADGGWGGLSSGGRGSFGGGGVEVCRVHGGTGLRAVCPISTESMPPGSMAWVSGAIGGEREGSDDGGGGRLLFGRLDLDLKLRWTTAYIGTMLGGTGIVSVVRDLVNLPDV